LVDRLTASKASELRDSLEALLTNIGVHHSHVSNSDYTKALTVSIYDRQPIDSYDERAKRLILQDN